MYKNYVKTTWYINFSFEHLQYITSYVRLFWWSMVIVRDNYSSLVIIIIIIIINVKKTYQFKTLCKDDMITLDN